MRQGGREPLGAAGHPGASQIIHPKEGRLEHCPTPPAPQVGGCLQGCQALVTKDAAMAMQGAGFVVEVQTQQKYVSCANEVSPSPDSSPH